MASLAYDLPFDECEEWMRALGYVVDGALDWSRLLKEAKIKSHKDMVKKRWLDGRAPTSRRVFGALRAAELRREKRTPIGERVLFLEDWLRVGKALALKPGSLPPEIREILAAAGPLEERNELERKLQAANERIEAVLKISTEPKKPRK